MSEILTQAVQSFDPSSIWEDANWYRALTLQERHDALRANTKFETGLNTELAQARLNRWKLHKAFVFSNRFQERLELDQLSEDELFHLLGEPIQTTQSRIAEQPYWLQELKLAFENVVQNTETAEKERIQLGVLDVIAPLIKRGQLRLQIGLNQLVAKYQELPFDPSTVLGLFSTNLMMPLQMRVNRILALEVNVARIQGRLSGETQEERYNDFLYQLSFNGGILPILREYPAMARSLVTIISNWVNYSLEFLDHLCRDWQDICAQFSADNAPGTLVQLSGGAGDSHRQGRSVISLKFSSGFRLIYKPRSLGLDIHFQELLSWLNNCERLPEFRLMKVIDRGDHGWCEFVQSRSCNDIKEVQRFYQRQGGYLALLHCLAATDFHYENLIAAGEHPVLIDLEALFHPDLLDDNTNLNKLGPYTKNPAFKKITTSAIRVGMLPNLHFGDADSIGMDVGGLTGKGGLLSPTPVPAWEGAGTDEMRMIKKHLEMPETQNRPRLGDNEINTLDYVDDILNGFSEMYNLLLEHQEEFLQDILPLFAQDETRAVLRNTQNYAQMLQVSLHPDLSRDALERDRFFDSLWAEISVRPSLIRVVQAEHADLQAGDIPIFNTRPASRDLYTSRGGKIADWASRSSLDLVKERITQLNEKDLAQQIWIIRATFATTQMAVDRATWKSSNLSSSQREVSREQLVEAANKVGKRLCELAIQNNETTSWLGLTMIDEKRWNLAATGPDMFNGTAGIGLFLAYLGEIKGEARYSKLAYVIAAMIKKEVDLFKLSPLGQLAKDTSEAGFQIFKSYMKQAKITVPVGPFDGLSGSIYFFTHLGHLWNEPELLAEAEQVAALLPNLVALDESYDITAGTAGCLLSLLALYQVRPSKSVLEVAIKCGEHLCETAQTQSRGKGWITKHFKIAPLGPLTGFSHGTAGIAWALLELAQVSGEARFQETALAAMDYERGVFSEAEQNWPDLRRFGANLANPDNFKPSFMTTWCHGAAGIAMGRLASLSYIDNPAIREEITIALETTLAKGFGLNHSLCHGDLGNLEALLLASQNLTTAYYKQKLSEITNSVLDSIEANGWCSGISSGIESPGLMTGIAGIGYGLLRLAAPEAVPSVLLLAPPPILNQKFRQ